MVTRFLGYAATKGAARLELIASAFHHLGRLFPIPVTEVVNSSMGYVFTNQFSL